MPFPGEWFKGPWYWFRQSCPNGFSHVHMLVLLVWCVISLVSYEFVIVAPRKLGYFSKIFIFSILRVLRTKMHILGAHLVSYVYKWSCSKLLLCTAQLFFFFFQMQMMNGKESNIELYWTQKEFMWTKRKTVNLLVCFLFSNICYTELVCQTTVKTDHLLLCFHKSSDSFTTSYRSCLPDNCQNRSLTDALL